MNYFTFFLTAWVVLKGFLVPEGDTVLAAPLAVTLTDFTVFSVKTWQLEEGTFREALIYCGQAPDLASLWISCRLLNITGLPNACKNLRMVCLLNAEIRLKLWILPWMSKH